MKPLTQLKAIRQFCIIHHGYSLKEVRLCPDKECPLYPFRFGHNPRRKGIAPNKHKILKKSAIELNEISKEEVLNEPS